MTQNSTVPATRREARSPEGRRGGRTGTRRAALAVVPLALLASGAMVYQASNAAFTARTSTGTNSWTAGNVYLSDSQNGTALFSVGNLMPGYAHRDTKCIKVSYNGTIAANIRMYIPTYVPTARTTPTAGTAVVGDYLRSVIEEGTGNQSDCTDFSRTGYLTTGLDGSSSSGQGLKSFYTSYNAFPADTSVDYGGGAHTWAVTGPATKTFRITYWLPDTTLGETGSPGTQAVFDDLQGSKLDAAFTWEAQSS